MPHGHTTRGGVRAPADEFNKDFLEDIMPYVESHYRTVNDRAHRALAGLSMGGGQTLRIGIPHLDKFAYLGVFSAGLGNAGGAWEQQQAAVLDNAKLKKGLDLFWVGIGKEDRGLESSRATVEMFKKHGFNVVSRESEGGHTWLNWRDYLVEFAPKLFQ
jgi:enterochelin esterase family protein